jgi:hypothetical protein
MTSETFLEIMREPAADVDGFKESLRHPPMDGCVRLLESVQCQEVHLDRAAGQIFGVKILGVVSKNGRVYTQEAIGKAAHLYSGANVYVDHGRNPRSYKDKIGHLTNISVRPDGLYGTLNYNKGHALAKQLEEDAESAPHRVGLSHDSEGKTESRNGKTYVISIERVNSVDLVANAATTNSLYY